MEARLLRMKIDKLGLILRSERRTLKNCLDLELEEVTFLEKTVDSMAKTISRIRLAVNAGLPKRSSPRIQDHFHSFRERRMTINRPADEPRSIDLQQRKVSGLSGLKGTRGSPADGPPQASSRERPGASVLDQLLSKRLSRKLGEHSARANGSFGNDSKRPATELSGAQKENLWGAGLKNRLTDAKRKRSADKDSSLVNNSYQTPLKPIAINSLSSQNKAPLLANHPRPTEKKSAALHSSLLVPSTTLKPKHGTPRPRQEQTGDTDRSDSNLNCTHHSKLLNRTEEGPVGRASEAQDDATEIEFDTHSEIEQSTPIGRKVEKKLGPGGVQPRGSLASGKKLLLRHAGLRSEQAAGAEQAHNSEMSLVELNYSPSRSSIDSKIYIMNNQASVSTFGIKMNKLRFERPGQRGLIGNLNQTLDP